MSLGRLENVVQDVLEDKKLLHWRRVEDVFETKKCLLESIQRRLFFLVLLFYVLLHFCQKQKSKSHSSVPV